MAEVRPSSIPSPVRLTVVTIVENLVETALKSGPLARAAMEQAALEEPALARVVERVRLRLAAGAHRG